MTRPPADRPASAALTIRRARPDEFDVVMELLADSIRWLRSKGLDQWSGWQAWRVKMAPSLARGDVWLVCDGQELIGTITVELQGDPDFWTPAELAEPAAYISKVSVRRSHAGRELGSLMLQWASDRAYRAGCRFVRLDAWKDNGKLHEYYLRRGWTYLRTSDNPRRRSGALFQAPAQPLHNASLALLQEVPAMPTLNTTAAAPEGPDPAGNSLPGHTHQGGLVVSYPMVGTGRALFVPDFRYRVVQRAGAWVLEAGPNRARWWERHGTVLSADIDLTDGSVYVITHVDAEPGACHMTYVEHVGEQAVAAAA